MKRLEVTFGKYGFLLWRYYETLLISGLANRQIGLRMAPSRGFVNGLRRVTRYEVLEW